MEILKVQKLLCKYLISDLSEIVIDHIYYDQVLVPKEIYLVNEWQEMRTKGVFHTLREAVDFVKEIVKDHPATEEYTDELDRSIEETFMTKWRYHTEQLFTPDKDAKPTLWLCIQKMLHKN